MKIYPALDSSNLTEMDKKYIHQFLNLQDYQPKTYAVGLDKIGLFIIKIGEDIK